MKIFRTVFYRYICIMTLFFWSTGSLHAMTIGEERDIGEKLLYKIRSEFSLLDDPDISQYINGLGQKVLAQVSQRYFDYRFYVIPSKDFNAFAAPSGLIFFYTGLIETMNSEDELLSVMAHEIAHVESRHIASRSDKNVKVGAITTALAIASLALGDPSLAAGLFTGFQAAGQAVNLHFSRLDEEQADRLSYDWMHAMHRDPVAMEEMLKTMRRIVRYSSEQIPPYLLTHPNPEVRLDYIESLLDYRKGKVPLNYYTPTDNFDFLRFKHRIMVSVADSVKARAYFTNILGSGRDEDEKMMATYGLALLQAKELNFSAALENIDKVKKHFPDHAILDVDAAIMKLDSGQIADAIELFEQAVQENEYDMYAVFNLALAYTKTGNISEAERLYQQVLTALPEYPQVFFELARIKSNQGETGISNFYLAKYYLYNGKIEFAREHFTKVTNDTSIPESMRKESEGMLKRLDELEKL